MHICLSERTYPKPYTDDYGRTVWPAPLLTVRYYVPESIYQALIV